MITLKNQTAGEALVNWAQRCGSTARTSVGAIRFLRLHRPKPDQLPLSGEPENFWKRRITTIWRGTSRQKYKKEQHQARLDARYNRLGEEIRFALGLPLYDERKDRARVARLARKAELARAANSIEEQQLRASGYALEPIRESGRTVGRLLSGMDDGHPFSVRVPLRCGLIAEAIRWLRPDDVPAYALRQGEWFFVEAEPESEGTSRSDAGSVRTVTHQTIDTFDRNRRHIPDECLVVTAEGTTCFLSRNKIKQHEWTGRPHVYARGDVVHPEHGTLGLGDEWHEVIPNRAHGPFVVGSLGVGGLD